MRGALQAGGKAVGIVPDSLASAAVNRENRDLLLDARLLLISPYDPAAGFNVGNAMQRNKLIYALADAALVASSDYKKGGTWSGATEQLQKHRAIPVYVRQSPEPNAGLDGLRELGALPWPGPKEPEDLARLLAPGLAPTPEPPSVPDRTAPDLAGTGSPPETRRESSPGAAAPAAQSAQTTPTPADELFAAVRAIMLRLDTPKTEAEIAETLKVSKPQAKEWLARLVDEGLLEKIARPIRYRPAGEQPRQGALFG
jgi:predicted Rossmann fold nucleotide-binding protein DprA/Smf involved in DNA uptake